MQIPRTVLTELYDRINIGIEMELCTKIDVTIVLDAEKRLNVAISSESDAIKSINMKALLEKVTHLRWKYENGFYYLLDGYVVVRDEVEDGFKIQGIESTVLLKQYYRISNTPEHPMQMFEEMLYIDGVASQETWDPVIEYCEISFANKLPE